MVGAAAVATVVVVVASVVVRPTARFAEGEESAEVANLQRRHRLHPSGRRQSWDGESGMDYYRRRCPYQYRHQVRSVADFCDLSSFYGWGCWWHTEARGNAVENLRAAVALRAVVVDRLFGWCLDGQALGVGLIEGARSVVWKGEFGVEVDLGVVVVAQLGQSR